MIRALTAAFLPLALCCAWQRPSAPDLPVLPLGRGDAIDVTVEDEPDLTQRLRISDKGEIAMPLLKDPLQVEGLLPAAIGRLIADAYKRERILLHPIVSVTPAEYRSYLVKVTGAVSHPYEFQALDRPTLLSVLATAGGPSPQSNGEIEIIRHERDTGHEGDTGHERDTGKETKQTISIRALLEDNDPKYNIVLRGGEEVHLPERTAPPPAR